MRATVAYLLCLLSLSVHAAEGEGEDDATATDPAEQSEEDRPPKKKGKELFFDDGAFDLDGFLSAPGGFLPFVIPITEPAIGVGAMGGVAFFHRFPGDKDADRRVPPSMTGLAAGGTSNGTWFVGAGHFGYYAQDRVRMRVSVGYANLKLSYFGAGGDEEPIAFVMGGLATQAELSARLGKSPVFAGLAYHFLLNDITVEAGSELDVGDDELESRLGGLGLTLAVDTLDSTFTADKGVSLAARAFWHDTWLGSQFKYAQVLLTGITYVPIHERVIYGTMVTTTLTMGDAPFYAKPYVRLRGVPAFRYVGDTALSIEGEIRWDVWRRWSLVAFGGFGAAITESSLSGSRVAYGFGLGPRYLLARRMKLRVGIDVARGPEQFAFYVVMGSAWFGR